jgi:hypothetical protein
MNEKAVLFDSYPVSEYLLTLFSEVTDEYIEAIAELHKSIGDWSLAGLSEILSWIKRDSHLLRRSNHAAMTLSLSHASRTVYENLYLIILCPHICPQLLTASSSRCKFRIASCLFLDLIVFCSTIAGAIIAQ